VGPPSPALAADAPAKARTPAPFTLADLQNTSGIEKLGVLDFWITRTEAQRVFLAKEVADARKSGGARAVRESGSYDVVLQSGMRSTTRSVRLRGGAATIRSKIRARSTDMTLDVQLREPVEADLPILHLYESDPAASQMAAIRPRNREAFIAHWTKLLRDETVVKRIILADGRVVGDIGAWNENGRRLVGYLLGCEHWGKGIATRALARFVELETTRPLYALVAKDNIGSIRVLEKNGFTILRQQTSHEHGRVIDELVMRLGPAAP
jgi:RimJ/RimL family protein N-acetyltransferase